MQETQNNIQNNILEKIKTGEVKMTSKRYFVLKGLTMATTSLFFLMLAIYIFAYVIFLFSDNGLMIIPFDTENNILKFIVEVPWTLVFLGLISVFLFSITSKTFYKIYKKPFLAFFFSILMIIVLSHFILLETGTLKELKQQAYLAGIRLAPDKLLQFRDSQTGNLFSGRIIGTTSDSLVIIDRKNRNLELFLEDNLKFSPILKDLFIGRQIKAYGIWVNGNIILKSYQIVD